MIVSHLRPRCQAAVYREDVYRYTGGRWRFAMHYARGQCERAAVSGDLCRQHAGDPGRERAGYHQYIERKE